MDQGRLGYSCETTHVTCLELAANPVTARKRGNAS
jgi:hypothetical protein